VDFAAVAAGMNEALPFNRHLGLVVDEVAPGHGVVTLPEGDHLHNHVGSQHAGALFTTGEAASGAAFLGAFAEHLGSLTPLAKSASIDYLKIARGPIKAVGTLESDVDELLASIDQDGKVEFPIGIEMTDADGNVVATMTVHWYVRRNA
jgi:acyl-coenzyme A thioesterase PaaI-like protein